MAKLEARVKQEYRLGAVTAFSGYEYIQSEWRPVPAGYEEQAKAHDLLDVREALVPVKGTAEEYLADKKGTADQYIEEVMEEDKDEPAMDNTETTAKRRKSRKKTVTTETEDG